MRAGIVILVALLAASGCTVRLISGYDEATDRAVTALQKKTEAHLVALESADGLPECTHEHHRQFYDEAKVDVSAIAVRAAAIPKNEITTEQVMLLSGSLGALEQLHRIACLSKDQIAPLRTQLNSSFTAILKLELAKRRGG
ncbi:MAG TPA: hypothetical protein PLF73_07140 [Luteimonas sp.]|nr:hypothetical protein [Luteimonas sp.]HRO27080.1 hypothetical protein [Luteimonas sp.]